MTVRQLQQHDWDQLLMVASGFLPLTGGDLRAAMAKAIAAHADLIAGVRDEGITAQLSRGTVTLFVPEEGGMALAFDRSGGLQVHDRQGTFAGAPCEDVGVYEDEAWSD